MKKRALIFGASGQDGPYLATELIERGYEVWGCVPGWDPKVLAMQSREPRMQVVYGDLMDPHLPSRMLDHVEPDVVYSLAAITFVPASWAEVDPTVLTNGVFPVRLLEAVRTMAPHVKVYQASTSEMFGKSAPPQSIDTPFLPVSPYAAAKLLAHHAVHVYRESYGLFAVSGVLFNHESPHRGREFVTRHVSISVARARAGQIREAPIGNLAGLRDWGHAADYVRAMVLMMENDEPKDYVVGTGTMHSVQELVDYATAIAAVDPELFVVSPKRMRLAETAPLQADSRPIRDELHWQPRYDFEALIREMVLADIERVERGEL
jgi:GDPmannose 4,6-dehydratase